MTTNCHQMYVPLFFKQVERISHLIVMKYSTKAAFNPFSPYSQKPK